MACVREMLHDGPGRRWRESFDSSDTGKKDVVRNDPKLATASMMFKLRAAKRSKSVLANDRDVCEKNEIRVHGSLDAVRSVKIEQLTAKR